MPLWHGPQRILRCHSDHARTIDKPERIRAPALGRAPCAPQSSRYVCTNSAIMRAPSRAAACNVEHAQAEGKCTRAIAVLRDDGRCAENVRYPVFAPLKLKLNNSGAAAPHRELGGTCPARQIPGVREGKRTRCVVRTTQTATKGFCEESVRGRLTGGGQRHATDAGQHG